MDYYFFNDTSNTENTFGIYDNLPYPGGCDNLSYYPNFDECDEKEMIDVFQKVIKLNEWSDADIISARSDFNEMKVIYYRNGNLSFGKTFKVNRVSLKRFTKAFRNTLYTNECDIEPTGSGLVRIKTSLTSKRLVELFRIYPLPEKPEEILGVVVFFLNDELHVHCLHDDFEDLTDTGHLSYQFSINCLVNKDIRTIAKYLLENPEEIKDGIDKYPESLFPTEN